MESSKINQNRWLKKNVKQRKFYKNYLKKERGKKMKIEIAYTFNHDEIHDRLHYQLIVESIGSDRWNTGSNKRN